ncbi:MAG TPA: hypothetical protein VNQ73_08285 [Ilumatobacter sp.]|nr:hypothetical protein [Ilumatobacter sp.]
MVGEPDRGINLGDKVDRAVHELGDDLFARGFLLAPNAYPCPLPGWRTEYLDTLTLHLHPFTAACRATASETSLVLIGHAFDGDRPQTTNAAVADRLATYLAHSPGAFYEALDNLNGRWTLIYRRSERSGWRVTSDATGMRAVFHQIDGPVVASHAALAALVLGRQGPSVGFARFTKYGFPGRMTPYGEIVLLPPNQELEVSSGALTRIWPRHDLAPLTAEQAAAELLAHLQCVADAIRTRFPSPLVSVTAGVDSRATLAGLRLVTDHARYFTYTRHPTTHARQASHDVDWSAELSDELQGKALASGIKADAVDVSVSLALAARFGLRHEVLQLGPGHDRWELNTYHRHQSAAVSAYQTIADPAADAHIRSNLPEIGRCFYKTSRKVTDEPNSGAMMTDVYLRPRRAALPVEVELEMSAAFDDFRQATSFSSASQLRSALDLQYWEHRMGAWHALVAIESDPAFETFSLFNCRRILDAMLAAPEPDRAAGRVLHELITIAWPDLMEIPINPRTPAATA